MRRWHSQRERAIMLRRWRQELAKHGESDPTSRWRWGYPHMALAAPSLAPTVACHCSQGIGSMRKRAPHDCGNPRCGLCHFEKFYGPKARATKRRLAIDYDLSASA